MTTLTEAHRRENLERAWGWIKSNPDASYKNYCGHAYSRYALADATSDKVIISSKAMNEYWLRFALYWGWGLFALTLNEVCEEFSLNDWPIADFPNPVAMEKLI